MDQRKKAKLLPHLLKLEELIHLGVKAGGRYQALCQVEAAGESLPVHALELGPVTGNCPAVLYLGGVHGLERIGSEVVMEHLSSLLQQLQWDEALQAELKRIRLVFVPILNPAGLLLGTRANGNNVDLMRNSPVQAPGKATALIGGHRLSAALPWFRGRASAPMEPEAASLVKLVESRLLTQPFSLVVDCHSGYGGSDHLWFPYAFSKRPIDHLAEVVALERLFFAAYPFHRIYDLSPQSRHYLTHGDLWDHLYLISLKTNPGVFLPLTLEMGSWMWLKKSPKNAFKVDGFFNPNKEHRHQRVLRRHLILLQFMQKAATNYKNWLPTGQQRQDLVQAGLQRWFEDEA